MNADDLLTIKCCDTLTIDQDDVLEMKDIVCYGTIISKGVIYFDSLIVTDDGIPPIIVDHSVEVYVVKEGSVIDFLHNISYSDVMCENVYVKMYLTNQKTNQVIYLDSKSSNLSQYDLSSIPSGDWKLEYRSADCKENESSSVYRTLRIIDDDFWLRIIKAAVDSSQEYNAFIQIKEDKRCSEFKSFIQVSP